MAKGQTNRATRGRAKRTHIMYKLLIYYWFFTKLVSFSLWNRMQFPSPDCFSASGGHQKHLCTFLTLWGPGPFSQPPKVKLQGGASWQSWSGQFLTCARETESLARFLPGVFTTCILRSWRWPISGAFYTITTLRIVSLAPLSEECLEMGTHKMLIPFLTEVKILNGLLLSHFAPLMW